MLQTDAVIKNSPLQLAGADGKTLSVLGKIELVLSFGNHRTLHPFIVISSLSHKLLVGVDFLRRFQCEIDLKKHEFRINALGTAVPLHTTRTEIEPTALPPSDLFTCSDVFLPPQSVSQLNVTCSDTDPLATATRDGFVLTRHDHFAHPAYSVNETLHSLNAGKTAISVTNYSNEPIFLAQGTPVATLTSPEFVHLDDMSGTFDFRVSSLQEEFANQNHVQDFKEFEPVLTRASVEEQRDRESNEGRFDTLFLDNIEILSQAYTYTEKQFPSELHVSPQSLANQSPLNNNASAPVSGPPVSPHARALAALGTSSVSVARFGSSSRFHRCNLAYP